jgi:hypothetical protein
MRIVGAGAALVFAALAGSACGKKAADQDTTAVAAILPFDTARVRLVAGSDTLHLIVELANSQQQRTLGLMERRHLADTAGMLFVYASDQPDSAGFWMYRTRIALDIAFVDAGGTIRAIRHMEPCPTTLPQGCPTYAPGAPYRAALEVNAGFLDRHKVVVGHRLMLGDTSERIGGRK